MKVKIQKLDEPNKNGRIYSTDVIKAAIEKINNQAVMGTIGMPEGPSMNIAKVSHVVANLTIEDGYLVGDLTILKTPMGEELSKMLDEMVFRTIGIGNISDDGEVTNFQISGICAIHKDKAA